MSEKKVIQSVKGTREFYPTEMALRNFIYSRAREASELFGFQEWDGPFLETIDLYAAKSGDELVKEQAFVFPDRGGDLITLRPELTPTLARMVAQKQNELTYPLRWWSFGPFWRYERPQRGRSREFFQWNVDMMGVNSPEADAELIAVAANFLRLCGLKPDQTVILINNRKLMDQQFAELEIAPENRLAVSNAVDRRNKMESDKWDQYVIDLGLTEVQLNGLKKLLADYDLWKTSDELVRLFAALKDMGVGEYVRFDPNIMRGLLYYTGTVFEAFDTSGSVKRAIFGGGRYDNLLKEVGGDPLSGVGFAMGDVVVGIILKELGLISDQTSLPAKVMVTIFDAGSYGVSAKIATNLRNEGINVILYPEPAKLQKQFKFADKMGIKSVVVVGPDEISQGNVTLKNLTDMTQSTISENELLSVLLKSLK